MDSQPSTQYDPADDESTGASESGDDSFSIDRRQANDSTVDNLRVDAPDAWSINASQGHIGGYELIRELGRGGFGIVYLARDLRLQRQVAIKLARMEIVQNASAVRRFEQEAQAAASLEHPGIISIFDCGVDQGVYYYVMPYLEGDHLGQWLAKQQAPLGEHSVASIMRQIAEAVQHGHQHGIIHRDLKPQNILLHRSTTDPDFFQPVVLDFGLCGQLDTTITTTTWLAGTPRYMPPEQARDATNKLTAQSDIYSLGVIMYELLAGVTPAQPETFADVISMLNNRTVTPLQRYRPDVSTDIDTICMKCLRFDPKQRYESAQSLAQDLQRFHDRKPLLARRASYRERIGSALKYGNWETGFGWSIVILNSITWLWAVLSAFTLRLRYPDDVTLVESLPQFVFFLFAFALPIHLAGIYSGSLLIRRTRYWKRLLVLTILSLIWTSMQSRNLINDQDILQLYQGRGVALTLVFLLISSAFIAQCLFLSVGTVLARHRQLEYDAG